MARANASVAAVEATPIERPGVGRSTTTPEHRVTEPSAAIFGAAYLHTKTEPQNRTSMGWRSTATSDSVTRPTIWAPARTAT